jgi:hypothetical protein
VPEQYRPELPLGARATVLRKQQAGEIAPRPKAFDATAAVDFTSADSAYAPRTRDLEQIDDWNSIDTGYVKQTDGKYDPLATGVADFHVVEP